MEHEELENTSITGIRIDDDVEAQALDLRHLCQYFCIPLASEIVHYIRSNVKPQALEVMSKRVL